MYLSFSLLIVILLQTFITTTNGLLLLSLMVFVVTFLLISFTIRGLIKNTTKSDDYFINNLLLQILVSNIRKPIIKSLTHCLNLLNKKDRNDLYLSQINRKNIESNELLIFCGNCLEINNESKSFAKLITDNYIKFWYKTINEGNDEFITECETILQQIFVNLFEKCEQKLNTEKFLQKSLILLEKHLIDNRSKIDFKSNEDINSCILENETKRVSEMVEKILQLLAPEDVLCVIRNQSSKSDNSSEKYSNYLSLYIMVKSMLTQSVFIPITNIITDPKFIYSNIIELCEQSISYNTFNSYKELNTDKNRSENENQSSKSNEQTLEEYELNMRTQKTNTSITFQTNSNQYNRELISDSYLDSIALLNVESVQQINQINSYDRIDFCLNNEEKDNLEIEDSSDFSGNESNDEFAVEALEAEDIDFQLFTNLTIPKTQETTDKVSYTLYCIEYDALFQEIDESVSPSNPNPNLFRKRASVYRRFSEFIALQKVLERNKQIKKHLKSIKKPSSIQITAQNLLMIAGSSHAKLDLSTIEFRRIFLQTFLRELCNRESIVRLPEFQQFLAYGSDARIAFVNSKPQNILPLNIDKVLYRGVKGAISIIKTAFPVEPQVGQIDPTFSDRIRDNEKLTIKSILTKLENNNVMQLEKKLNKWKENECNLTLINYCDSIEETTLTDSSQYTRTSETLGPRSRGDGCEAFDNAIHDIPQVLEESTKNKFKVNNQYNLSLSSQLIKCLLLFMKHNVIYVWHMITTRLIELIFGFVIENYIREWLEKVITRELFLRHIHKLHLALWPLSTIDSHYEPTNATLDESIEALYLYIQYRLNLLNPYLSCIFTQKFPIKKLLSNILLNLNSRESNKICFYNFVEMFLNEIE